MTPDPQHLDHLFTSNLAPTPIEISSIQNEIERSTNETLLVQLELDQLQYRLKQLKCRRQGLRTLLSPIRRMPPEVLGEIFAFVLGLPAFDEPQRGFEAKIRVDELLIGLCLVCRTWRDAASATPQLWRHLEIPLVPSNLRLEKAFRWFDRCKGIANKTLMVGCDRHGYTEDCAEEGCNLANPELARLLTEGPLFEKLALCCMGSLCFRALIGLMDSLKNDKPRPWDSIKSLDLTFYEFWDEIDPSNPLFQHIPPVTSLSLYLPDNCSMIEDGGTLDDLHIHPLGPVLANLTTFTLACDWDDTVMIVLQLCVNVEVLTLDFLNSAISYNGTQLLLPKVRTLRLRNIIGAGGVYIIRAFKIPMLVELDIGFPNSEHMSRNFLNMEYPPGSLARDIQSLVIDSRCERSLRKLRLDSVNFRNTNNPNILENIVATLPSLTHLTLDNVLFDLSVLDKFDHGITPRLEVLELLHLAPDFPVYWWRQFVLSTGISTLRRHTPFPPSHMFHDGVLLPNVRILRLRHMQDAVHVIQIFKTPVLVELDISFANYSEDAINFIAPETLPQDFAPFVIRSRSNERLRKFRLDSVSLMKSPIIILDHFPSLTHLALDHVHFHPSLLYVLSEEKNGFIPHVEVLELLRLAPDSDFPLDPLEDFVWRRRKPGNPPGSLKKLVTTFRKYEPPDFDDLDQLFEGIVHVNMIERSFASGFA